ncbi:XF1762 family protein [Mycolicibacterium fortuitum]|uniref:XF1762 family protein n=1 Tax=Mycolicibacterium fortuitum TaxID=1766 RepID=UPI001F276979|nr:XF1762 family protein [Mycolicibacterium fortuitum]
MIDLCPVSFRDAAAFVQRHHRHHKPPRGMKFAVGVAADGQLVGVALVGRPVARMFDDGWTLEVNRTCTDGYPNANSMLYGAAWRAAKALGYRRLITYTLASESGASLRAAGWHIVAERPPRPGWDMPGRPRNNDSTEHGVQRTLWEAG